MTVGHFVERAPHEVGFARIFADRIMPVLRAGECERLARRRRGRLVASAIGVVGTAGAALVLIAGPEENGARWALAAFAAFGAAIAAGVVFKAMGATFDRRLAEAVAPILCAFMEVDRHVQAPKEDFLDVRQFRDLRLVGHYGTSKLEDGIEGRWKGVRYRMAEALLQRKSGQNSEHVVFAGLLVEIETDVDMPRILFLRDAGETLGWLRETLSLPRELTRMHFPDADFEALYAVYTDDLAAAQAAITPEFGRTLMALSDGHHGARSYLAAAFTGRRFYLAFRQTRDFLNLSGYGMTPVDFVERCRAALEDLAMPRHIIDRLLSGSRAASSGGLDQPSSPHRESVEESGGVASSKTRS